MSSRSRLARTALRGLRRLARDPEVRRAAKDLVDRVTSGGDGSSGDRSSRGGNGTDGSAGGLPTGPAGRGTPHDPRRGEVDTASARPEVVYAPVRDGDADPGEIVWAWVPYEDDPGQGKDRPLLVIGRWGDDVAALALTSRRHDDRHHHPLGGGPWDSRGRPSWVKLDRLLRLDPDGIRREGAILDEQRFRAVVSAWEAY